MRPRRRPGWPRPERFFAPVSGAILLLLAWAAVAHASGSGWVQAVGTLAAGLVVVGMGFPAFAARRLRLTCTSAPRDAACGETLHLEVTANRPLRVTPLAPSGVAVVVARGAPADLEVTLPHRGVLSKVTVRLATAAPLGLLWWSVDRTVALPVAVHVAPWMGAAARRGVDDARPAEGRGRPVPALTGELRGVRDYQHGDGPRLVHWRATAHTGRLMVRELEEHPDRARRVVVRLPDDPDAADEQAAEALATVNGLIAAGRRVTLETTEESGPVVGAVADRTTAGRRLARAGSNPYAP